MPSTTRRHSCSRDGLTFSEPWAQFPQKPNKTEGSDGGNEGRVTCARSITMGWAGADEEEKKRSECSGLRDAGSKVVKGSSAPGHHLIYSFSRVMSSGADN